MSRLIRGNTAQKRTFTLATFAILIAGVVLWARYGADEGNEAGRPLRLMEWKLYDYLCTSPLAVRTPMDPKVLVVGIDDASMDISNNAFPEDIEQQRALKLMSGVYPWSREIYALLIDKLIAAGTETVMIDLVFPAPSKEHAEGDEIFRKCLDRHADKVVLAADVLTTDHVHGESEMIQLPHNSLVPHQWPPDKRIGFVTFWTEEDEVVRGAFLMHSRDGSVQNSLPAFSAAALRLQGRASHLPQDEAKNLLRFGEAGAYVPVSLHEIFTPDLWTANFGDGAIFNGKTVLLGHVARQQQDFHRTPLGLLAGVRLHAQVYAALKSGSLLRTLPGWVEAALYLAVSLWSWVLVSLFRRPLLAIMLLILSMVALVAGQLLLYNYASLVWHTTTPLFALGLIGAFGFTYNFVLERRQKLALKRTLTRFHSPDVAEQILDNPESYFSIRDGATRSVVALFSDVRGYTSLSEELLATEMVAQLNEYFERMVAVVFAEQGAVDKFIGDGLMAIWGRFRDEPKELDLVGDACRAVQCALSMRKALVTLNKLWRERKMRELSIGIGIHQGEAVVGEIGSNERAELTAIGDCVNLGARLEGATKEFGVDLLISEVVFRRVENRFLCRPVDLIRVRGKRQPVEVFTVLGPKESPKPAGMDAFEEGMEYYRRSEFTSALDAFERARREGLSDFLTNLYIERANALAANPPPADWDGVFTVLKK